MSLNKAVQPVRMALAGRLVSPGIFESMYYLGKDECQKRIEKILAYKG
jgi:glutamyl-tRNA synthetase